MMRPIFKQLSRFLISIAILAGVAAGGYFGFRAISAARGTHAENPHVETEHPAVLVRVAEVELRKLVPTIEVIGMVQADPKRFATLSAATPGLVAKLVTQEGKKVAEGEVLVEMDDRLAQVAFSQADATFDRLVAKPRPEELAQAKASVTKMKSAHSLMEARLRKSREMQSRNPELVPEVQLLDDIRNAEVAKADWNSAESQLELLEKGPRDEVRREARTQVESAQLLLDYCKIIAPFAGEIVDLKARVGQRAEVGTPLVTLLDSSEVIVQARIPANRLPSVVGLFPVPKDHVVAEVRSSSFPDRVFPATSGWLSRQTEGVTGDVPVRLRVHNPDGTLRVGMTVKVTLLVSPVESLAIPEEAYTVNEEGKTIVVVVREDKAFPTEIELRMNGEGEIKAGGWVSVEKGLQLGDQVIVENGYALPEGTPVKSKSLPPK